MDFLLKATFIANVYILILLAGAVSLIIEL